MAQQSATVETLNQLLAMHSKSLPVYLSDAKPWVSAQDSEAMSVIGQIADEHRRLVDAIGTVITLHRGVPKFGEFPMQFTDMHDLSLDYLVKESIARQKDDIRAIEQMVDLAETPAARAVVQECLGSAKGSLDNLSELTVSASTVS